jgi:Lipocalin-like domain
MKPCPHSRILRAYVLFAAFFTASTSCSLFAQTATARPADAKPSVREQLIGSWRLVSRESRRANGEMVPDAGLATVPLGLLIYDRSGHVAAQLSRQDRTLAMLPDECRLAIETKGTPDTAQTILGYDAYFGTFTIDEKAGTVTHHLVAAIFPGDIGKDIQRRFSLSGNRLTISFDTTTRDAVHVTRTLIWERLE